MNDQQLFLDLQSPAAPPVVDERKIYVRVMRWLAFLSMKKLFSNFKSFYEQPTFLTALSMALFWLPSAAVFHLFFNKFGFAFRFSALAAISTPIQAFLCALIVYRYYMDEAWKAFTLNFIFKRMIELNFLPSYNQIATNFNETPLVMVHTLKSEDPVLKFFGLKQVQKICSGTPQERKQFYSLSQPGGHPRNWTALRDVAIESIHAVRDQLQSEARSGTIHTTLLNNGGSSTSKLQNGLNGSFLDNSSSSPLVLNERYEGRPSLFVPPSLKPRTAERFLSEIKQQQVRLPFFLDIFVEKFRRLFAFNLPKVPAFDVLCAILAIRALSNLIIHSLNEDQFGVVQKDLKRCLSTLARLSIAIDSFVKATAARMNGLRAKHGLDVVHALDGELAASMKEIRDRFGFCIGDLGLDPIEMEVFTILA